MKAIPEDFTQNSTKFWGDILGTEDPYKDRVQKVDGKCPESYISVDADPDWCRPLNSTERNQLNMMHNMLSPFGLKSQDAGSDFLTGLLNNLNHLSKEEI